MVEELKAKARRLCEEIIPSGDVDRLAAVIARTESITVPALTSCKGLLAPSRRRSGSDRCSVTSAGDPPGHW
jgi:hypothetical protein